MNHAEPDHAGAISYLMEINNKAKVIVTRQGAKMAQTYYDIPEERLKIVSDREKVSLGGKNLRFIEAPMLHWPETMFTYLEEDKILLYFSHVTSSAPTSQRKPMMMKLKTY